MKKIALTIAAAMIILVSCEGQDNKNQNIEILNTVWETINTQYFDSTFNGLDWQAEYDFYKPIIASCMTNDSLYYYLNQMLFKLNVSHLGVISPDEPEAIANPRLMLDGTLGMDVRYMKGQAIITSVRENSSAFDAGIKPGFTLLQVNGKTIEAIVAERKANPTPPFNDRNLRSMITQDIVRELYGTPGDMVKIRYLNADNSEQNIVIPLKKRSIRKVTLIPDLPPMYASIDHKIINDDIAYLHLDAFLPHLVDTFIIIINEYKNLPNLILDLRGNPGGLFNPRRIMAEQFVSERTLFWKYQSRNGISEVFLNPVQEPYTGNLVIIIDELSTSSSEEFSGGMKAIGRATIIGQRTPGKVLTMEVVSLPDGGLFVYPNQQTLTSGNEVLEAVGVVPDLAIELRKEDLLEGIDTQLEKAIEYLNE